MTWISYDAGLVDDIAARLDLRTPNAGAIRAVAEAIEDGDGREVVCDLATGVGKTYILAGLVDYLATQGIRNILVVTPGTTIQDKTLANFTPGHPKYVPGGEIEPLVITTENFARGQVGDALHNDTVTKLFVFNVQQLIRPSDKTSRRVRAQDEFIGTGLYQHLQQVDDLVVIADEHHVYNAKAKAFNNAIEELGARAVVGLTATPAPGVEPIFQYSLAEAIADGYVKIPVIVYRPDGRKDEQTVLADACHLLRIKDAAWTAWAESQGEAPVRPVLFVVCRDISDADRVANRLTADDMFPGEGQVLTITSQSSDVALRALAAVEEPDSPVRVVVSVNKLKEGWDVKNIGVIVGLRALASETLTEQVLGRGLRLPYGRRVGTPMVDSVDLIAHESYRQLLANKEALLQKVLPAGGGEIDENRPHPGVPAAGLPDGEGRQAQQEMLNFTSSPRIIGDDLVDGSLLLQVESMDDALAQGERDKKAVATLRAKVPGAPTIRFPRREREILPVKFSFSYIDNASARAEGAAYAQEFKVTLARLEADPQRGLDGTLGVHWKAAESVDATQKHIPITELRSDLFDRIWNSGYVDENLAEVRAAERVVREFLAGAGVTAEDQDHQWGELRATQAATALGKLVEAAYNNRKLQPSYAFHPVDVPTVPPPPMPSNVVSKWETFRKDLWYADWEHSIEPVASFDARSTEYTLAHLFDGSPSVQWWLRNYDPGPIWIERDNGKKYYPDFIVLDTEGTYWVVEGKANDRANDPEVQEKKRAAEDWARFVRDFEEFGTWRYIFATETIIKNAQNSWESLLALAKPE
ncbi:DEAD/DEAH box helicase family protein [Streptomyces sp. SID8361]|uniref:DEAD/DEAH box helicase n=1 Tax=Streptomyces sp. MnatMP-M27 TaxID=1839768 RepID=UPI00081D706E|nr:DEAD/DEAH box helicase family protein [Streptomyces sp. MnatMP-M27]MYU09526.1 DEAD/DEAH box helicase family protein [Streptomyces sp. SID8361]SCF62719.1 type III restriction enzyme [Streptomyces sp. MnatMP-M27]